MTMSHEERLALHREKVCNLLVRLGDATVNDIRDKYTLTVPAENYFISRRLGELRREGRVRTYWSEDSECWRWVPVLDRETTHVVDDS